MKGVVPSADGVSIRHESEGTGSPAVVLVHGWSCDRDYWREQVPALAAGRRVVTLDLAGHGESGLERREWTMEAYGQDVVAVVDALDLPELVLVGHSMGGDVALEAALRLGDRVRGVVLVDTYRSLGSGRSPREVERILAPFREDFPGTTRRLVADTFPASARPELAQQVAEAMATARPDVAIPSLEAAKHFSRKVPEILRALAAPVVALNAESAESAEGLERHGVRVVSLAGAGHFPMLEDPAAFGVALRRVLDELAG